MPSRPQASLDLVARIGYSAKGVIYFCIGIFSALAGYRGEGGASDSRETISAIARQPFGQFVLIALVVGLICYVAWQCVAAFADPKKQR